MSNNPTFIFDVGDTKKFEGLRRPWDRETPFLTPVFFNKEVLVRYFYDPRYLCRFVSDTYGTIKSRSSDFELQFGVNRNERVIIWYGDLIKADSFEQQYLVSENIQSDHHIESQFYDAQIKAEFTKDIKEIEILQLKLKIQRKASELYKTGIYRESVYPIEKVFEDCRRFKRMTFGSEDDLKRFVSEWNELLIESLDQSNLRSILRSENIQYDDDHRSLKLFELFLLDKLHSKTNHAAPFYYLYDLRLWADHANLQKNYEDICTKLGANSGDHFDLYEKLIESLLNSMNWILDQI